MKRYEVNYVEVMVIDFDDNMEPETIAMCDMCGASGEVGEFFEYQDMLLCEDCFDLLSQ